MSTSTLPLDNLVVIDLTVARAGPSAVRLLSDWGANVIRIDKPTKDADKAPITGATHSPDSQNLHRNKRSLSLDLKSKTGYAVFCDLVKQADIVVENFRSDVKQRLGFDYDTLAKLNPRIILGSISGFGQDGPDSNRAGVDQVIQGVCGLMSITGAPGGGPMRAGIAISDTTAGMFLGQGILLALLQRQKTGKGQWVHTSLLEAMLNKLDFQAARYVMNGENPEQEGNFHPTLVPMGMYKCKDGNINIAASTNRMFNDFCTALNAINLIENPNYQTAALRKQHREQCNRDVADVLAGFTVADLITRLNAVGVPCGPVNSVAEAFADAQVQHLNMKLQAEHRQLGTINLLRSPINLSDNPRDNKAHRPGPEPGEHSVEILKEFGYDDTKINQLISDGVVS